ncbi:MAG: ATP synthase F1 subunit delta [Deltaproteobacteria bacterium]|jgi:F-type H+-transporting ATPase subunit delta|nr:ATP synthase F1 subunit delta [Deltaproteobacteria bacterium]MCK5255382.1 ATP synthase F1 subunit delta [Deltaproteobacteria bacterium]
MSWIAARRYARALMDIGIDRGTYKQYARELTEVQEMIQKVPILKATLLNLSFSNRSRKDLLMRILEGTDLSVEVINFFSLLVEKDRIQQLPIIIKHYGDMVDECEGQVRVSVHSVIPLEDNQLTTLEGSLERALKKKIVLKSKVNKELIGGIMVKVNNLLIDSSVRTQLRNLAETLRKE